MNALHKTADQIFNALAFANVSNLGEFRALLRQIDEPAPTSSLLAQPGKCSQEAANAPLIGHIQGAR